MKKQIINSKKSPFKFFFYCTQTKIINVNSKNYFKNQKKMNIVIKIHLYIKPATRDAPITLLVSDIGADTNLMYCISIG